MKRVVAWLLLALALGFGCRSQGEKPRLVVSAASSLAEVVAELKALYESKYGDVEVVLNLGGSQQLRAQIERGAPVDVFLSANVAHVESLASENRVAEWFVASCNSLVVAVPTGNPAGLRRVEDLVRARRIVLGADEVPVGLYAQRLIHNIQARDGGDFATTVEAATVSKELSVRAVRNRVLMKEADAAVIYRSDALAAGAGLEFIEISDSINVIARYPVARLEGSANPEAARRWMELVRSPEGQAVFERFGFRACEEVE
ncbi:MAG: molybdate ABC transporter substrate-binding protein [Deltaproteobacteria bacterium CG2_30_63_29]|nr:MAG: molybdate ABC transporter substrate-binding protein [Deltaproteobacteria bacterium CG2_30_63_29]PIV98214.1 MAG: molybdate ABC transporter substrate-binding protein [Deltaproteobacteria bacterium CG17_big_fil_post_rev_8_21_14_2_50_63_7]PJB36759.1 MAG: molybdate ABC transporter substrate-binding protein [Deltaproteobacteria bacterium CG_4_9_14_3_um_filter_63_12]